MVNFSLEAQDFVSLFNALDVEPILSLVFNWGNELDPLSLDLHSDDIWSGLNVAAATQLTLCSQFAIFHGRAFE